MSVIVFLCALLLTAMFSTLFAYFFGLAWDEEHAWWKRCAEKLALVQRFVLRPR